MQPVTFQVVYLRSIFQFKHLCCALSTHVTRRPCLHAAEIPRLAPRAAQLILSERRGRQSAAQRAEGRRELARRSIRAFGEELRVSQKH